MMTRNLAFAIGIASLLFGTNALAGEQVVKLSVDNMWCGACTYIVKQTLSEVEGVHSITMSYGEKTALVTYDDAKTTAAAVMRATASAGFPSKVLE